MINKVEKKMIIMINNKGILKILYAIYVYCIIDNHIMKHSIFESSYLIIYRYYINICHGINKDKFKIPIYSTEFGKYGHIYLLYSLS